MRNISTSNDNYVCFKCRTSIRCPKTTKVIPKCVECDSERFCLGYKVEIPKYSDKRSWRAIEIESMRRKQVRERSLILRTVRRQHALEQEIERLGAMADNRDRLRQIKKLEDELACILARGQL